MRRSDLGRKGRSGSVGRGFIAGRVVGTEFAAIVSPDAWAVRGGSIGVLPGGHRSGKDGELASGDARALTGAALTPGRRGGASGAARERGAAWLQR